MAEPATELDIILETCLDRIRTQDWSIDDCLEQYPVHQGALEAPLRAAARLQRAQAIAPSLRFKENASERLQARLRSSGRLPVTRPAVVRTPLSNRWSFSVIKRFAALAAVLGLIVALAAGTTGVAHAADGAVPGDTLYSIDRGMEHLELSLTKDSNKALRRQISFTDERLDEVEELAERGNIGHLEEAIDNYDQSVLDITQLAGTVSEQSDDTLSQLVDQTFSKHQSRLGTLLGKVPEQAQKGIQRALEASSKGHESALKALNGNKHDDSRPGNEPPGRNKTPGPPDNKKGHGPPDKIPGGAPPGKDK
jgi:hypothetical protein